MALWSAAVHPMLILIHVQHQKGGDPMSSEIAVRVEPVCLGRMSEQPSAAF